MRFQLAERRRQVFVLLAFLAMGGGAYLFVAQAGAGTPREEPQARWRASARNERQEQRGEPVEGASAPEVSGVSTGRDVPMPVIDPLPQMNTLQQHDPILGNAYPSVDAFKQTAVDFCLALLPEDWVETRTDWVLDGKRYKTVPVHYFLEDRSVSEDSLARMRHEISLVDESIRGVAAQTRWMFEVSARDYVDHRMVRVPTKDAQRVQGALHDEAYLEHERASLYVVHCGLSTGDSREWRYLIDFQSSHYPELERGLIELRRLSLDKMRIAERTLGTPSPTPSQLLESELHARASFRTPRGESRERW